MILFLGTDLLAPDPKSLFVPYSSRPGTAEARKGERLGPAPKLTCDKRRARDAASRSRKRLSSAALKLAPATVGSGPPAESNCCPRRRSGTLLSQERRPSERCNAGGLYSNVVIPMVGPAPVQHGKHVSPKRRVCRAPPSGCRPGTKPAQRLRQVHSSHRQGVKLQWLVIGKQIGEAPYDRSVMLTCELHGFDWRQHPEQVIGAGGPAQEPSPAACPRPCVLVAPVLVRGHQPM